MAGGTPGFIGDRLKQSREAHGLTATGLAELIGVSKQAVSQYEKGTDSPRDVVLDRICTLFHHEQHFFLRPIDPHLVVPVAFYRSMASATKMARLKAEARQMWIRELVQYLSEYVDFPAVVFPSGESYPSDPNQLSMDDAESAASELRSLWNLGDGPIVNLLRTMEQNGALVLRHPLDAETLDGLSGWAHPEMLPYVLLNSDKDCAVRSRLDLAHELGHLVLHRKVQSSVLHKQEMFKVIEDQAFRFGAALLLPEKPFLADLYSISLDALRVLKKKWKVSIGMMIERLKHIGMIDAEQHRRLRINYVARKWTRQEPFDGEIPIEQPSTIPTALRVLVTEGIQTIEQVSVNSGFSEHWLRTLMGAPEDLFSPPDVGLKIIPFKRRA